MKHFKKIHKLSDHNQALTAIIAFLVILSISLTIVESVSTGITKETQQLFFAIHMSILLVFFFELVYRIAIAPRIFPEYSSAKARVLFIAHPLTIIDIIVIIPLFLGFIHPDL